MELDDFKKILKKDDKQGTAGSGAGNGKLDSLISEMQIQDEKDRKKTGLYIIIFFAFVAIYSGLLTLNRGTMRDGFSVIVLGFVLATGYMFRLYLRVRSVDYTLPAAIFLRKAEKRYRFMNPADLVISCVLIAIFTLGGGMVVSASFAKYAGDNILPLIIYLAVMASAITIGFISSHRIWEKEKADTIKKIRSALEEFCG